MKSLTQGTPVSANIPPEIVENFKRAYGLRRPEQVDRVDTVVLRPEQWTKKQRVFEMLRQRPTSLQDIASELSVSLASAKSLVGDVQKMIGRRPHRTKVGEMSFYSINGVETRLDPIVKRRTRRAFYRELVVALLKEKGGKCYSAEMRDLLEEKLKGTLAKEDCISPGNGLPKWWMQVNQARYRLILAGVMKSDSRYGVWELADPH